MTNWKQIEEEFDEKFCIDGSIAPVPGMRLFTVDIKSFYRDKIKQLLLTKPNIEISAVAGYEAGVDTERIKFKKMLEWLKIERTNNGCNQRGYKRWGKGCICKYCENIYSLNSKIDKLIKDL